MLAKLFKYDFKAISRILLPATLLAAAMTVLGTAALKIIINIVSVSEYTFARSALTAALTVVVVSAALGIFAYSVISAISVYARFYKNLFTDEGYLTFTLPVKTHTVILSKMFAGILWELITAVVVIILAGVMISVGAAPQGEFINAELVSELFRVVLNVIKQYPLAVTIGIIAMLAQLLYNLLMIFLAITIGSTVARKQKILASIGFYFALSTGISIISSVLVLVFAMIAGTNMMFYELNVETLMTLYFAATAIFYAVIAAVEFFFVNYIAKNKLNLA